MRCCAAACMVLAIACSERAPTCSSGTWGTEPLDAAFALEHAGEPLVFSEPGAWIESGRGEALAAELERVDDRAVAALPAPSRVVLQNDLFGLWHRVGQLASSSPSQRRIARASARIIRRAAAPARAPTSPPPIVAAILPPRDGWRELESEMPLLQHERLFGVRRIFHVREARGRFLERALYSTLVAIDGEGRAWRSDVVGDLEVLRFDGDRLVGARLFELDRRRLRCDGPGASLVEVEHAEQVPGRGADGALARFDPPAPLAALPCTRCHDDASAMSLPSADVPHGWRHAALLGRLAEPLEALARDAR